MEALDVRVLRTALSWHEQGLAVALVTVTRTWGSSPRPPGSLMAVSEEGCTVGSVSGGCIEDDLVAAIRTGGVATVCEQGRPAVLRYGVSAEQARRFGLPCGGTVELVLELVGAQSRLAELLQAREQRRPLRRELQLRTGEVVLASSTADTPPQLDGERLVTFYGPSPRLILIGAGDLARFLAEVATSLGFQVEVCDPRSEHAVAWDLPGVPVHKEMPDDLILRLQPDARTAIVALTHDPKLDDLALIDALTSPAFYVGAIGSRRNSAQRLQRLREHFGLDEGRPGFLNFSQKRP